MTPPEPRANPVLIGHTAAETQILEAMRSGRVHHAWLITGPPGIGKATLAFRFARRLLVGLGDGDTLELPPTHPVFRRVAAASHADLLTVEREWDDKRKRMRGEIVVDAVRRIADFMRLTPAEGGWRVVVLDGAEDLNRNAANAVLKVLEEPPPRAVLLLTCAVPGRLLPTMRSRCRRLRLTPVADPDMARALHLYLPDLDDDARARLALLAEGSPGRALALAAQGGLGIAELVGKVLDEVPGMSSERAMERGHALADAIGRNEDGFSTFMDLLRADLSAAVRDAARGRADPDQARVLGTRGLDTWVDVWRGLTHLQDETERLYLDKRQAIVTGMGLLSGTS